MKYVTPNIIDNDEFLKSDLDFKWDETYPGYFLFDVQNEKLVDLLWSLNHKATVGLAAALSEWILWRLSKIHDVSTPLLSNESLWLGLIDKHYVSLWGFDREVGSDIYYGSLWVVFNCLKHIRSRYFYGEYQIQYRVMNLAMFARYVTPNKKLFDSWLGDVLSRATRLFPAQYDRGDVMKHPAKYDEHYDSQNEPFIPRDFFFKSNFDYRIEDSSILISQLLDGIDYSNEKFFNSPEYMIETGFIGTPYQYEVKK